LILKRRSETIPPAGRRHCPVCAVSCLTVKRRDRCRNLREKAESGLAAWSSRLFCDNRIMARAGILVGVVLVAAFFRFNGLTDQGLLLYDEGQMVHEGGWYAGLWETWLNHLLADPPEGQQTREALVRQLGASPILYGKPVHNAFVALLGVLVGNYDTAALWLSALAGVATVFLVYLIAASLWGVGVGLTSAAVMALSPYHIMYGREALAESVSVCFWGGALALWSRGSARSRFWAAVLAGVCFAANYRAIFIVVLAPILFLYHAKRDAADMKRLVRDGFLCALGFSMVRGGSSLWIGS